ncbi:zinc finger MYM-type protein 1-like [Rhagoletis pomonella]|uniref:zinc finger MYM-type protein 1-like n=1 Tax=Rhagoletis pomonella TaxID=28610 RepID=UPI0017839C89|nr:zinc finger MYM-type protein 1-like [Rhagoletis pomonella]
MRIMEYGNKGSGTGSYLSKTICDEFIEIMADKVRQTIIEEMRTAKYYSIIVDSTPDIYHTDQLAFVNRYVKDDGSPVERFLHFIENPGHKSEELFAEVYNGLMSLDLDIMDCRGQSYDTAANMSGIYSGLQARIKEINDYADYAPCGGHNVNLAGTHAAESCTEASAYFGVLQSVYTFFTGSTNRWEKYVFHCSQSGHRQRALKSFLSIDCEDIIREFAAEKSRRKEL